MILTVLKIKKSKEIDFNCVKNEKKHRLHKNN